MHLHLDAVGGIAGDMFAAALLDVRPDLAGETIAAIRAAGLGEDVALAHEPCNDGVLAGSRFAVSAPGADAPAAQHHDHVHWSTLRRRLAGSALAPLVRERAIDIFAGLAAAEAAVHGKPVDSVSFHEVGAWDSIADIVAAAFLIEQLGAASWSIGAIPIGSGRVKTAHGLLPVPAPATVLLLEGYACFDDGFPGERVTPTGAAIVRHLAPTRGLGALPRRLLRSGHGFGTRRIEGLPNVLRVLEFAAADQARASADAVTVLRFEVDDQTAEDLALGLERLRAADGVIDVTQVAMVGKHGRQVAGIQVLARPEQVAGVAEACFHETTTLGLRLQPVERLTLARREAAVAGEVRVKLAERAAGATAKAELADLAAADGHAARQARRAAAEAAALDAGDGHD